ncbi:MAG: HEAT repeat domain-containing protein [Candidatus Sumerlaeia bacterium]|nr:HEAT repeat domain-containing protein [Candidatus Sumerlaeia bacterium]
MSAYRDVAISEFLLEKLKDPATNPDFKNQILRYFSVVKIENSTLNDFIAELIKDENAGISVRSYAVYAAGELKLFSLKNELASLLEKIDAITDTDEKKKYSRLRLQIITALLKLEAENVEQILFDMARDDDEAVRLRAIRQLSQFNRPEIIELLEYKAKYDNSLRVQREAKKALETLREGRQNNQSESPEAVE